MHNDAAPRGSEGDQASYSGCESRLRSDSASEQHQATLQPQKPVQQQLKQQLQQQQGHHRSETPGSERHGSDRQRGGSQTGERQPFKPLQESQAHQRQQQQLEMQQLKKSHGDNSPRQQGPHRGQLHRDSARQIHASVPAAGAEDAQAGMQQLKSAASQKDTTRDLSSEQQQPEQFQEIPLEQHHHMPSPFADQQHQDDQQHKASKEQTSSHSQVRLLGSQQLREEDSSLLPGAAGFDPELAGWSLVLVSLSPQRLWAFLSLGIPGGLGSSVEGAASEVTTAMAGILGRASAEQVIRV